MAQLALPRAIVRGIVDFTLPPRCPGCGTVTEDDHRFCLECWGKLDLELEMYFSGLGKVKFDFTGQTNVAEIARVIAGYVL